MEKLVIGVIDSELNNVTLLNRIGEDFSFAKCIYYNIYFHEVYEEHSPKEIFMRVEKAIEYLKSQGVNLFLFLGGEVLDALEEKKPEFDFEYISLASALSSYANDLYKGKDIAFFAKNSIFKANVFQRGIDYLHLYSVFSDEIEASCLLGEIKTDLSFAIMKKALSQLLHKSVDIALFASLNSSLFFTEINEFRPGLELVDSYIPLKLEIEKKIFDGDFKESKFNKIIVIDDGKHLDTSVLNKCLNVKIKVHKVKLNE